MDNLIAKLEGAAEGSRELDRLIALAVGWVRLTPSEAKRKHPAWFHPDDCRNGKPVYDSLHGTDVWRDPSAYTTSLDAAMTLVPQDASGDWWQIAGLRQPLLRGEWVALLERYDLADLPEGEDHTAHYVADEMRETSVMATAPTPALAVCISALKARAQQEMNRE